MWIYRAPSSFQRQRSLDSEESLRGEKDVLRLDVDPLTGCLSFIEFHVIWLVISFWMVGAVLASPEDQKRR